MHVAPVCLRLTGECNQAKHQDGNNRTCVVNLLIELESTNSKQSEVETRDDTLLLLRSQSTSEKNFAVHLICHFFLLHKLDGQNVRGVGKKLLLDQLKMERIRQIIFKIFSINMNTTRTVTCFFYKLSIVCSCVCGNNHKHMNKTTFSERILYCS